MGLTPLRHGAASPALPAILDLIRRCFEPLNERIDPPSSIRDLSLAVLARQAAEAEVHAIGDPPQAAMILSPRADHLYLGKLAVDPQARRRGLALQLLALAEDRALALSLPEIRLQSRIELAENHALFRRAGFVEAGRTAHPGFDRPTSVSFVRRLPVPPPPPQGH